MQVRAGIDGSSEVLVSLCSPQGHVLGLGWGGPQWE